ncbi:MAG TPA: TetR/AcrR family transcriptional regulator [Acidimicrobiia bacterium]|nr:TetR/AcrR family transcriptional regulator [Acidimicrobiia bacterium]
MRRFGPGRTDPRVDRTRQAVSEVVLSLLMEDGWESVTHARVSEVSGISRTTLYRHWPEKVDLLREALVSRSIARTFTPTGNLRTDLVTELGAMVSDLVETRAGVFLAAIVDRSEWDPTLQRMKEALIADGVASLRGLLQAGQARGELRPAPGLDVERGVAELVGPVTYRRFISGEPIRPAFVEGVVDDFLAANRPA